MSIEFVLTLKPIFVGFASILGISWTVLAGQVMTESSGDPNATGGIGEIGLAQIILETAQDRVPSLTEEELYKPEVNVIVQGMYLIWLRRYLYVFHNCDDWRMVFAAYNHGIGKIKRILDSGGTYDDVPPVVQGYVDKVYKLAEMFKN